jgi:hypothetical protein
LQRTPAVLGDVAAKRFTEDLAFRPALFFRQALGLADQVWWE